MCCLLIRSLRLARVYGSWKETGAKDLMYHLLLEIKELMWVNHNQEHLLVRTIWV